MIKEPVGCSGPQWDLLAKKFLVYLYPGMPALNKPTTVKELQEYLDKTRDTPKRNHEMEEQTDNENSDPLEQHTTNAPKQCTAVKSKQPTANDTDTEMDITTTHQDNNTLLL
jgi:hypothetical protein